MAANKTMIMIIAGGQMQGLGMSLRAMDPDDKGTDDLVGHLCQSGGSVLINAGLGNVKGARGAVQTIRDACDTWLQDPANQAQGG
jgi:hypothetical protein